MKRRIKNKIAKRKGLLVVPSKEERIKYHKERRNLLSLLEKNIKKANIKIRRISNKYGKLIYASKNLKEALTSRKELKKSYNLKKDKIVIKKSLTNEALKKIKVLLDRFLKNKTSSILGIKERMDSAKKGLKSMIGDVDTEIDDKDIEMFANVFQNDDFRYLTRYGIDESEFVTLVQGAIEKKWSEDYFVEQLTDYMQIIPDEDMKEDLQGLYNKYVRGNYFGL